MYGCVTCFIKLLLESPQSMLRDDYFEDLPSLSGDTLIVVRSKDDITLWERALREHTPFSTFNFAGLPSSERKRPATASRSATFDIVITTYDALKSTDCTVRLDDDGHVVLGQEAESQAFGGWMNKRSASSSTASQRLGGQSQRLGSHSQTVDAAARCTQLSVLHRVQWRRIIFSDELGRKCFLAKKETARAQAAAAVNANTR